MKLANLTIVGVGLIGGSIGLAARRRGLAARVVGVGRSRDSLDRALAVGAIDEAALDLSAVRRADFAVFCTPVERIADQVIEAATGCRPGTLLTDAGSTKGHIVRAVTERLPTGVHFVGSHPLAGSEKRGPEAADADLFQGRVTVVTPGPATDPEAATHVATFWRALGCRVRTMDPDDHDRALALTSHLPHLAASALAGVLPPELRDLTATGFRDTTRVAAGDPALWTGIFLQNRDALLAAADALLRQVGAYRTALLDRDREALDALLVCGKENRDALGS